MQIKCQNFGRIDRIIPIDREFLLITIENEREKNNYIMFWKIFEFNFGRKKKLISIYSLSAISAVYTDELT